MSDAYEGWAILEAFGHIRTAGRVREVEQYGAKFCRIDIPKTDGVGWYTQDFGGEAIFRLTPTTEETARRVAAANQPAPVHAWELPQLPAPTPSPYRDPEYAADDDPEPHPDDDDEEF